MFQLFPSSIAAHLHSGQLVAVKVQRPGMSISLTRDALLFHMIGGQLKRFAKARKDLLVAVNEMVSHLSETLVLVTTCVYCTNVFMSLLDEQVRHMFDEIDYVREAKNAERFASLYSFDSGRFSCFRLRTLLKYHYQTKYI